MPTMGYLHDGHLSLVRRAAELAAAVWVSIFVNPTQFAPGEDLERYPRDLARDLALLGALPTAVVFAPSAAEMYPRPPVVQVGFSGLERELCGASRPTHFAGVGLVVAKLFNIVQPEVAVFGQKDAQQALLFRRLAADLVFPLSVEVAPTVREADGAAMRAVVAAEPVLALEYAACRSLDDLGAADTLTGPVLLAVAARAGRTRLIDSQPVVL